MNQMFIVFIVGLLLLIGAVIIVGSAAGLATQWIAAICLALAGLAILIGSVKMMRHGSHNTTIINDR